MKSLLIFEKQDFGQTVQEMNHKIWNERGQNRIYKGVKTSYSFHDVRNAKIFVDVNTFNKLGLNWCVDVTDVVL